LVPIVGAKDDPFFEEAGPISGVSAGTVALAAVIAALSGIVVLAFAAKTARLIFAVPSDLTLPSSHDWWSTVSMRIIFTSAGDSFGFASKIWPAIFVTAGVAWDVPLKRR
jgi:hypothetical protein